MAGEATPDSAQGSVVILWGDQGNIWIEGGLNPDQLARQVCSLLHTLPATRFWFGGMFYSKDKNNVEKRLSDGLNKQKLWVDQHFLSLWSECINILN